MPPESITQNEYTAATDELENKPLSFALNKLAILANQKNLHDFRVWIHYELNGYTEEVHKKPKDNQIPTYRNLPVIWRDLYGRPLLIEDPKLFKLLSNFPVRQGVAELEGYMDKGIIMIPEHLPILSQLAGVQMKGGFVAKEALFSLFNTIRLESLRRLSEFCMDIDSDSAKIKPTLPVSTSVLNSSTFRGKTERAKLRAVLNDLFKIDSQLDAFCMDYFPSAYKLFSAGMDKTAKMNLLLQENLEEIRKCLQHEYPEI